VPLPTADFRQALSGQKAGFVGPEALFDPLMLRYVDGGADKSGELLLAVERRPLVQNPAILSVGAPQPILRLEGAAGVK